MRLAFFALLTLTPLSAAAQAPKPATPSPTPAPDLTTIDGHVYRHARIHRVEPDGVIYMYDGGMSKIGFEELPEAVRKQFNYDPDKAAKFARDDAAEQQSLWAAGQQSSVTARQQEQKAQGEWDQKESTKRLLQTIKEGGFMAGMKVDQGMDEGIVGMLYALTGAAPRTLLDKDTRDVVEMNKAIVFGVDRADGEYWKGMVYPCGIYRGTAISGAAKSMRAYATTPEAALEHYKK